MSGSFVARLVALAAAAAVVVVAACGGSAAVAPPVMVFAAASLTAPFEALAAEFEKAHPGTEVDLHFAGTPQLVLQLREGAPADVFASADEPNMAKVVADGITSGTPRHFVRNRLAIVVKHGNPLGIVGLADLARPGSNVALCGPDVPAGRYARLALAKAGVVVQSVSDEPSVKALVSKVQLGELDAGIVYATDCRTAGVAAVPIDAAWQVFADYPIAALRTGRNRSGGDAFVQFVLSPVGRRILESFGFLLP